MNFSTRIYMINNQSNFSKQVLSHFIIILIIIPTLFLLDAYYELPNLFPQEKNKPFLIEEFFPPNKYTTVLFPKQKQLLIVKNDNLSLFQIDYKKKKFHLLSQIPFQLNSKNIVISKKSSILYFLDKTQLYSLDINDTNNPIQTILLRFTKPINVDQISFSNNGKTLYIIANNILYIIEIHSNKYAKIVQKIPDWNYGFTREITQNILYAFSKGNIDIFKLDKQYKLTIVNSYVTTLQNANIVFSESKKRIFLFHNKRIEVINTQNFLNPKPFGLFHFQKTVTTILSQSNDSELFIASLQNILIYHYLTPSKMSLYLKIPYQNILSF